MLRGKYLGVKTKEKKAMVAANVVTSWREETVSQQGSLFVKNYIYVFCTFLKCNIFHSFKKKGFLKIKTKEN